MAQKRMFDKSIVFNDKFIEMPDSAQNLYFHLSMTADDDGFVDNWKSIMRMTGKKEDDLKILIAKSFILPFESGVIVIKHWRINNYLRQDRYRTTKYVEEKNRLSIDINQEYSFKQSQNGIPTGNPVKYSIEKYSIDNNIYAQFNAFWNAYPKKKDKAKAQKWFEKNKPSAELVELMIKKIEQFKETDDWKKEDGRYIPYPTTWLNGKRWEDEIETHQENVPEWFGKEINRKNISKEDEENLKNMLKEFE